MGWVIAIRSTTFLIQQTEPFQRLRCYPLRLQINLIPPFILLSRLDPSGSNDLLCTSSQTQRDCSYLDAFGWHIPMDELIDSLYALSFDSLSYDNQAEVINFIKGQRIKDDGTHTKRYQRRCSCGSNFVVADMLEVADALQKLLRLMVTRQLLSHFLVPSTWQKKRMLH